MIAAACALAFVVLLPIATSGRLSFLLMMGTIFSATGSLIAAIIGWSLGKTASKYDDLTDGREALVRWTCDEEGWRRFRTIDARERRSKAREALWFLALMGSIFVGAAVAVYVEDQADLELSVFFLLLAAGFGALVWGLRRSALALATRDERPSTACIGRNAMAFRGQYVQWRAFGVAFVGARIDEADRLLRITYAVSTSDTTVEHDALVPIPVGREDEARELVHRLR